MAQLDPTGEKQKQKKKSASAPKRSAGRPHKSKAPAAEEKTSTPTVGRLERTRRLLLAALKVWELKRRIRD